MQISLAFENQPSFLDNTEISLTLPDPYETDPASNIVGDQPAASIFGIVAFDLTIPLIGTVVSFGLQYQTIKDHMDLFPVYKAFVIATCVSAFWKRILDFIFKDCGCKLPTLPPYIQALQIYKKPYTSRLGVPNPMGVFHHSQKHKVLHHSRNTALDYCLRRFPS